MSKTAEKLKKRRDELSRKAHDDIYATVGAMFTAEHFESAHDKGFDELSPTWLNNHQALFLVSMACKIARKNNTTLNIDAVEEFINKALAESDEFLRGEK